MPNLTRTRALALRSTLAAGALSGLLLSASPVSAAAPDEAVGGAQLGSPGVVVGAGSPALPPVSAASWLVADLDSGEVLAAKNAHGLYAPASTLKTLTALTLIPVLDADTIITPTNADIDVEGSKVGLVDEVAYPAEELFEALLMVSGNDAANALATAAGGQEKTAELMNAKAVDLGALDTRAVNPHGLDAPGQISSAYDLALISRAGLADDDFARYVSTRSSSVSAPGSARIGITNKNKLLRSYEGALGVKNGFTSTARASFVGAAERDGRRIVVTLMKATPKVFDEAVKLLDWGFAASGGTGVGQLVDAEQAAAVAVAPAPQVFGPPSTVARPVTEPDGPGVPEVLGGLGLAVAALLTVRRRRPRPVVARSRPVAGSSPRRQPSRPAAPERTPVGARRAS